MKILTKILSKIGALALILGLTVLFAIGPLPWNNTSTSYADIDRHFRYGSIGGESSNGIPYWIWKVLPTVFSDLLPKDNTAKDYTAFGFMQERNEALPIGFARSRSSGIDVITQNCATCHVGSVRTATNTSRQLISGMPAHNVDLQGYIQFLRSVAADPRFNSAELLPYIKKESGGLNPIESLIYRFVAIPVTREQLGLQRADLAFMDHQTRYGPGRVDTFTPYKTLRFKVPVTELREEELNGIADFPPIWQQGLRQGLKLHWDGNNDSVDERNKSAALALVQPTTINFKSIHRVRDWLMDLKPTAYPLAVDQDLASTGKEIYQQNCAACHAFGGKKTGTVEAIQDIATDPGRLNSYTRELQANQFSLFSEIIYKGEDQRFTHFRKTNGYANLPLDGVWLRAPYLHNGSVPTMADLLTPASDRPKIFYRGNDTYDSVKLGFVSDKESDGTQKFFRYDTSQPANGNQGHEYGVDLSSKQKQALIEYLKTV